VNFTHGRVLHVRRLFRDDAYQVTGSFALAMFCGAAGTAILALVFERVFMSRVYGGDVLMQLLVCYAFVLIFDDVVRLIWGPEFKSMGMPRVPGAAAVHRRRRRAPYYLLLIGVALAVAAFLGVVLPAPRSAR